MLEVVFIVKTDVGQDCSDRVEWGNGRGRWRGAATWRRGGGRGLRARLLGRPVEDGPAYEGRGVCGEIELAVRRRRDGQEGVVERAQLLPGVFDASATFG